MKHGKKGVPNAKSTALAVPPADCDRRRFCRGCGVCSRYCTSQAIKTSEAKKKEIILEGKDEVHRLRNESERELNERRKEVQRQERRINQKEETLDKKIAAAESKEEAAGNKLKKAEEKFKEA